MATINKLKGGIMPASLTVWNADGSFNRKGQEKYWQWLLDNGATGLSVCGSTGENMVFFAVILMRKKAPDRDRPFKCPLYPGVPLFAIIGGVFMFIIGFVDFFAVHKSVSGATFTYFPSATIEMIGYLTMTLIASFLLRYLEKKLEGGSDYELVQKDPLTQVAGNYNYPDAKAKNTEEAKK